MRQFSYLHIPKTAGTSLVDLMTRRFGDRFRQTDAGGLFWHRPYLANFDCILGHIPFQMFGLDERPRDMLCLLRDPIDRVMSAINHFLSETHHSAYQIVARELVRLPDLMRTPPFCEETSNLQTRMLGMRGCDRLLANARAGDFRAFQELYAAYVLSDITSEHLERAQQVIVGDMRIGTFEELPYCVSQVLGELVPIGSEIPHLRAPMHRTERSPELLQAITDANSFDLRLYEFARRHFLECAARHVLARSELVDLPGAPTSFKGLFPLERYNADYWRWTDGEASLDVHLPLATEAVDLHVRLWDLDGRLEQQNVVVAVDGAPLAVTKGDREYSYRATSRPVLRNDAVRSLSLTIDSTTVTFHGDTRTLGVPIRSIAVRPLAA